MVEFALPGYRLRQSHNSTWGHFESYDHWCLTHTGAKCAKRHYRGSDSRGVGSGSSCFGCQQWVCVKEVIVIHSDVLIAAWLSKDCTIITLFLKQLETYCSCSQHFPGVFFFESVSARGVPGERP